MKKIIIKGLIYIIIGYILGNILFKSKIDLIKNITNKETYYFIEEKGSNTVKTSIKGYDNLYIKKGISRNLETANKIKSILEEQNKKVTIKEKYLTNKEFKETVTQFDNLINETSSHEEILKIEETVIATYEEILRNNTNS